MKSIHQGRRSDRLARRHPIATLGSALALAAPLALVGSLAVTPARAGHTPLPETVTVAGSIQTELGRAADWDPACEDSQLPEVGDSPSTPPSSTCRPGRTSSRSRATAAGTRTNYLDWTGQDNGFGHGLPPTPDNEAKWPYAQPLLANPDLKPTAEEVQSASATADDLRRLRFSSQLFRLGAADTIEQLLTYRSAAPPMRSPVSSSCVSTTPWAPTSTPRWRGSW